MNFGTGARRDAESTLVAVNDHEQLHLRHFSGGSRNTTVVLLHGLCEDGSLYFRDEHALAGRLARDGYDVWVPDLRGKGRSWPALAPGGGHGVHATVTEDLSTVFGALRDAAPDKPFFLVGHGTGGLLWLQFLARWPVVREFVRGIVLVGAATQVEDAGLASRAAWWWRYGQLAGFRARRAGLVPGPATGLGDGPESIAFYDEVRAMLDGAWVDPQDGLDHGAVLRALPDWPPTLVLAAESDAPWSGRASARALQALLPAHDGRLYVWPRASGVRLLGRGSALAGGEGAGAVGDLVLDWLAVFDG